MENNKLALITGAARGIGKAIALKFAQKGYRLFLNDISWSDEDLEDFKNMGIEFRYSSGDISDLEYTYGLIEEALDYNGSIDVLINNAGITRDALMMRMKEEDFDSVIRVNLKGSYNTMKAVTRPMMKQRYGKIINLSSVVGLHGNPGQVNYSASKAGVIGMTKSLAKELASRNINVNAIAPGFIKSEMTDAIPEENKKEILKSIPLGDMGQSEDVANLAYFLASEDSKYITGQVISVDGGMSI